MSMLKLLGLLMEYAPKILPLLDKLLEALEIAKKKQQLLSVPEDQIDSEIDKHIEGLAALINVKK